MHLLKKSVLTAFATLAVALVYGQTPDSTAVDSSATIDPSVSISFDALENEAQTQDVSGLLQSSNDVFTAAVGFNFSAVRFRMRGMNSEYFDVMMNGVPMNDRENGWAVWGYWGGLNDMTRYPETQTGVSSNQWSFGGIAGFSNLDLRPSTKRPGSRVSYAYTNRSYRHRVMGSYNSGMNEKGWAYSVMMSSRWSQEGYVEGTYYSALGYFGAVEKKINDQHSVSLIAFGAPTVQARQGVAVDEAYKLTGNPYYNPWWGYQNGEKRNARVRNNHKPHIFLTHEYKKDADTRVNSTAYTFFGRTGNSNLNWYDAADPRPDYYKNLPSYFAQDFPQDSIALANLWMNNDASTTQIDFDQMYFANSKNLYALPDGTGEANRSKYVIEEYRVDPFQVGGVSIFNKRMNDRLYLTAGGNAEYYSSRNFKVMKDLLGGDFWLDVDQFAEQQFEDPDAAQNDLENPNAIIREGDAFGYDYTINQIKAGGFGQLEMKLPKIEGYVGLNLSYTSFWRVGSFRNGRFPDNSFGKSATNDFLNYGVKGGLVYKITGRHYATVNAAYMTMAPFSNEAYIAPRVRDDVVNNLGNRELMSADINYIMRFPNLKARVTGYYAMLNNQIWTRSFYHDEERTFVNYTMSGVDQINMGIELGVSYTIAAVLTVNGALGIGDYFYNSRPSATITADNSAETIAEDRTIYLKNYKVGGAPQTVATAGLRYNSPKFWFVGVSFNYFADNYLTPNPDRRTAEAVEGFVTTDPQWSEVLDQTQLDNGYTIDAFAGYSWRVKSGKYLRFNLSATNLMDMFYARNDFSKKIKTGGFEQLRYDSQDIGKFPPKFYYMYGTTIFAMVTFQF